MNIFTATLTFSLLTGGISQAASLIGTTLSLDTIAQVSASSEILRQDFPISRIVTDPGVEYPDVESLFGPEGLPPGARFINTSIDAGADFLAIDFDNAGSGAFANWLQNSYEFTFDGAAIVNFTSAALNTALTTLPIAADRITFEGDKLRINASGVTYNPNSFLRIDLTADVTPTASIPAPAAGALLLTALGALALRRRRRGL